jgi:hypothetical protein
MQMSAQGEVNDGSIDCDAKSKHQHQIERATKRESLLPFDASMSMLNAFADRS